MELINLDPNDDDIFDQSEAKKLSHTTQDRESTYWQALLYEQAPAKKFLIRNSPKYSPYVCKIVPSQTPTNTFPLALHTPHPNNFTTIPLQIIFIDIS